MEKLTSGINKQSLDYTLFLQQVKLQTKKASVLKKNNENCFMATYSRSDPLFQLSCVTTFY